MDLDPPSECVKSPAHIHRTLNDPHGPRYGRPSHRFGPPTALFSKPLALLKYRLDHLKSFTPDPVTVERAFGLISISTCTFDDEICRKIALRCILETLLPGQTGWQQKSMGDRTTPGAAWFEGPFTYLIFGLENEQGLGGDPILKGLLTYGKVVAQPTV